MKWWIRAGIVMAALITGFCKMPVLKVGSGDRVTSSIRYVALGDSIAHGYGLTNPEKDSYVGQVTEYLEEQYDYVFAANLGTDGQRSDQLLDILTNPDNEKYSKYHATLKYADIITLSIGSNDLLHLVSLDRDLREYIQQGDALFREACREFARNFPKIIQAIRHISPEAEIYANNVYNPCGALSGFQSLSQLADRYIDLLNETFQTGMEYTLVNIREAFDQSDKDLLNMAISGRGIDPHPNREGHKIIGTLVIQAIKGSG